MTDVKIGVNADGSNVAKAIDQITNAVNNLAKSVASAGQVKFKPVDVKAAEKDIEKLNQQFNEAIKRSRTLASALRDTGQSGKSIHEVDFSKLGLDPKSAQRMRDRAFGYAARGTAWDVGRFAPVPAVPPSPVPPSQNSPVPGGRSASGGFGSTFGRFGSAFSNGVGGGFGQISNSAIRGAQAGAAEGGGAAGGAAGLLRGGLIGAGLFGLFKAGQSVSEGYDMAKERDMGLDSLKRQMGDLGISFAGLKAVSDEASKGLGVNSKEFVALAEQYNKASHNADKSTEGLGDSTRSAVGFGRAYGLDPSQSVGFFGTMKNLDPKQNSRELAMQIAEAINKSGGRGMAGDVMQFVQTMASNMARLSLSAPNTGAYAAAYGSMLRSGSAGMTADTAAGILGQANNAMTNMGNAGEAGKNFTLGSFSRYGISNPFVASTLASGGLFATPGTTFGADTEYGKYLRNNGVNPDKNGMVTSGNRDVTNFEAIRKNLDQQFNDPFLKLDAAKNFFGLQSNQQAAALMNLDPHQASGLGTAVKRAGIDINQLNSGGMATLAAIGGATDHGELDGVYSDILKRTGKDALSRDDKATLDSAQKGSTEDFRTALIKIMSSKDQQETEGSKLRASIKDLETVQTSIGDKLIGPVNTMRDALLKIAGGTAKSLHKAALDAEVAEMNDGHNQERSAIAADYAKKTSGLEAQRAVINKKLLAGGAISGNNLTAEGRAALAKQRDAIDAQLAGLKSGADSDLAGVEKRRAADKAAIDAREQSMQAANEKLQKATVSAADPSSVVPSDVTSSSRPMADIADGSVTSGSTSEFDIKKLMAMGWTAQQAAGIAANLKAESGSNEKAVGDHGLAFGIAQWHPERQAAFAKFAGHDIRSSTHDEQLAFVNDELRNGKYKKVGDKLSHLTDANDAGALISREYESPSDAAGEASRRGKLASTLSAVHDSLTINLKIDTTGKNAQGATVQQTLNTRVTVPRGVGAQTVNVS